MEVSGQLRAPSALSRGKNFGTRWIGGWVGPRASVDVSEKRKNLFPLPGIEPRFLGHSIYSLDTIVTELSLMQWTEWGCLSASEWNTRLLACRQVCFTAKTIGNHQNRGNAGVQRLRSARCYTDSDAIFTRYRLPLALYVVFFIRLVFCRHSVTSSVGCYTVSNLFFFSSLFSS
jgi:hypothetical protein